MDNDGSRTDDGRGGAARSLWPVLVAGLLSLGLAACGGDGTGQDTGGTIYPTDTGTASEDAGGEREADTELPLDTGSTGRMDGGADGSSGDGGPSDGGNGDTGRLSDGSTGDGGVEGDGGEEVGTPEDRDGDGVKNAEDNCPDAANMEQEDRDRDGFGNACDHYPFLHDKQNPKSLPVTQEDEPNNPNDDARAGEDYDLSLPFIVDGEVGPIEDDGDLDYYSFEVDEPTALLLSIRARTTRFWPGAVTFGYEGRNANIQTVSLGAGNNQDHVRGIFLPVPGKYSIAVTDLRNLLPDGQTPDVDGGMADYKYRVTLGKIPLPEPKTASVPSKHSETWPGRLRTWKIDARNLDALTVSAKGVSVGTNQATHHPTLYLWDPTSERVLAHTILQNVDSQRQRTELVAKLDKQYKDLVVVEGYIRRFRNASTIVEFGEPKQPITSEFETVQKQQDERVGDHVWMQPGQTVEGTINAPWTAGSNKLEPDVDYYLMNARAGQAVRVTLEPKQGSQFQGDLNLGNYLVTNSGGSNFFDAFGHQAPAAEMTGQKRSVEFFYNSRSAGEIAIRVRHAPNNGNQNAVGGPGYGYKLKVETWTPQPVDMDAVMTPPGTTQIAGGSTGIFKFTAKKGQLLILRGEDPSGFNERIRLTRTADWKQLRRDYGGELTFVARQAGTYWFDVRDSRGRGTDGNPYKLTIQQGMARQIQSLPALLNDMSNEKLADKDDANFYRFKTTGAAKLDFRIHAPNFRPRLEVYELPAFDRVASDYRGGDVVHVDGPTELIVKVSSSNNNAGNYTLGIREIMPKGLGTLPATDTGAINDQPYPVWYKASVTKDKGYRVAFEELMGANFDSRLEVYQADDLGRLETSFGNSLRFRARKTGDVYIALYDRDHRGDPSYKYKLEMSELPTKALTVGSKTSGQLADGSDRIIYTFQGGPGLLEADVTAKGAWTPRVKLLDGSDFDTNSDAEGWRGLLRYPTSEQNKKWGLLVRAKDSNRTGPLNFDVEVTFRSPTPTANEMEPNDTDADAQLVGTFPAVLKATLGNSGDASDRFKVQLKSGQRVWGMVAAENNNERYSMVPWLELYDPAGNRVTRDLADGDFNWPALYAERADTSGAWTLRMKQRNSSRSGTYLIYIDTSTVFTAQETEPNDGQMNAQALGPIDTAAHIQSTVDAMDGTDVYRFKLTRDLDELRVFLEGANDGHDLRLLDAQYNEIAAQGPNHGGAKQPNLTASKLKAGTYYVELKQGTSTGGQLNIVLWPTP